MFALVGRDITEKKKREDAMLLSEQMVRAILNVPTDLIFLTDADGIICDVNDTALRYLDKARNEVIGTNVWSFVEREDLRLERIAVFDEVVRTGTFRRIVTRHSDTTAEHVIYPAATENGRVTRVSIMLRDISGRDCVWAK